MRQEHADGGENIPSRCQAPEAFCGAVLRHNHPSAWPNRAVMSESPATSFKCVAPLGIKVHDHIIIGDNSIGFADGLDRAV